MRNWPHFADERSPILPQQFRPASDRSGDRVSDIDQRRVHDRVGRWSRVKMSALGHKRTFAPQKVMSALPPKATLNAFSPMCAKGQ
jgi:hypothetical protein